MKNTFLILLIIGITCIYTSNAQSRVAIGVDGGFAVNHIFWSNNPPIDKSIQLRYPIGLTFGINARYTLNSKYALFSGVKTLPVQNRIFYNYTETQNYNNTQLVHKRRLRERSSYSSGQYFISIAKQLKKINLFNRLNSSLSVSIGPSISWRGEKVDLNRAKINLSTQNSTNSPLKNQSTYTYMGNRVSALIKAGLIYEIILPNTKILGFNLEVGKGLSRLYTTKITYKGAERFFATTGDYLAFTINYFFPIHKKQNQPENQP